MHAVRLRLFGPPRWTSGHENPDLMSKTRTLGAVAPLAGGTALRHHAQARQQGIWKKDTCTDGRGPTGASEALLWECVDEDFANSPSRSHVELWPGLCQGRQVRKRQSSRKAAAR